MQPDLLIGGHFFPHEVEDGYLDSLVADAHRLAELHDELLPAEGFGERGFGAWIEPYRSTVAPGGAVSLGVKVRNPFERGETATVRLLVPEGWSTEPATHEVELDARGGGRGHVRGRGRLGVRPRRRRSDPRRDAVRAAGRSTRVRPLTFANDAYRLDFAANGRYVTLASVEGSPLLTLSLLAAVDTVDAVDETLSVSPPDRGDGPSWSSGARRCGSEPGSSCAASTPASRCSRSYAGAARSRTCVSSAGARSSAARRWGACGAGARCGRSSRRPPRTARPHVRPLADGTTIGVVGDGEPGRGRWLFTPAPLYVAFGDGTTWLDLGVAAPVSELRFAELALETTTGGFSLALDYDGRTTVDGEFASPTLVLTPNVADPHAGLRRHRDDLAERGAAAEPRRRESPAWWREPIFCGWGAQCHLEIVEGGLARDYATQERYDGFLAHLEEHGLVPGTIVLDDKWQTTYGGERARRGEVARPAGLDRGAARTRPARPPVVEGVGPGGLCRRALRHQPERRGGRARPQQRGGARGASNHHRADARP